MVTLYCLTRSLGVAWLGACGPGLQALWVLWVSAPRPQCSPVPGGLSAHVSLGASLLTCPEAASARLSLGASVLTCLEAAGARLSLGASVLTCPEAAGAHLSPEASVLTCPEAAGARLFLGASMLTCPEAAGAHLSPKASVLTCSWEPPGSPVPGSLRARLSGSCRCSPVPGSLHARLSGSCRCSQRGHRRLRWRVVGERVDPAGGPCRLCSDPRETCHFWFV